MKTFRAYSGKAFDKNTGIAKGVSVIAVGPALGHGTNVDKTSLATVVQAAKANPDGIKVHIQHDSDLKDLVGFLNNFSVDGDSVRADLKLVKMSPWFGYLCELIETNPSAFGLSISFDGTEETVDDESYIRVKDLFSVDLVSAPAANASGLFASKVIRDRTRMSKEATEAAKVALDSADGDGDNDLANRVGLLETGFAEMKAAFDKMAGSTDEDESGDGDDDEESSDDVESDNSDDMSALQAELAALKAENEALKAKSTSVNKLAARKLASTGVKHDKRSQVKASTTSAPTVREQFDACKTLDERVHFFRNNRGALKTLQSELMKESAK